jgi:hypothetical protein
VRLLGDIREAFDGASQLRTGDILTRVIDIEDAPWGGWIEDKSDKARGGWLARKLRPYSIRPSDHRFQDGTYKGYLASDFHEAWSRYLPPLEAERNKGNKRNSPGSDVASVASVASQGSEPDPDPSATESEQGEVRCATCGGTVDDHDGAFHRYNPVT